MRTEYYKNCIDTAASLPAMEAVIEEASMDDGITNAEYEALYEYAMRKLIKRMF